MLPTSAREVFAKHGYRLWDISPLATAAKFKSGASLRHFSLYGELSEMPSSRSIE
jgi:hypothetical protein